MKLHVERQMATVLNVVADRFGFSRAELCGIRRQGALGSARRVAIYLAFRLIPTGLASLGWRFQGDHTTIRHALERVEQRRRDCAEFAAELTALRAKVLAAAAEA